MDGFGALDFVTVKAAVVVECRVDLVVELAPKNVSSPSTDSGCLMNHGQLDVRLAEQQKVPKAEG